MVIQAVGVRGVSDEASGRAADGPEPGASAMWVANRTWPTGQPGTSPPHASQTCADTRGAQSLGAGRPLTA